MKPSAAPGPARAVPKSRLRLLLGVLGAAALLAALSFWPSAEPAGPSPVLAARSAGGRAAAGGTDPASVPVLELGAGRGAMSGEVGRDVFRFYNSPTPTPTPIRPTPTPIPVYDYPRLPTPTPTATPIIPPAIPFKAIGRFGPRDEPIVALEEGNRILSVREGDVVDGRFIVKKINRESVDIAFTGLPPEITRRIPIPLP